MKNYFEFRDEMLAEATLKIMTDLEDYPVAKQAKKLRLKAKLMKGQGDGMYGPDAAELSGKEQDLIKYAKMYLGFDGRTFKDLKQLEKDGEI